jgi:long-chain acyl-CoA synthetase
MAVTTISELFINTIRSYPKDDLILYKKDGVYVPLSSSEVWNRVKHLSLGLKALGLKPKDKIVIVAENRPDWTMTDFAIQCLGAVAVPIYPTLMPEQIGYIIRDSDARMVVCSNKALWDRIAPVRESLTDVSRFIIFDPEGTEGAIALDDVIAEGKAAAAEGTDDFEKTARAVQPGDLASIIYTSGTTGIPKGVMLTNANFLHNIKALSDLVDFNNTDRILSFLPLSHVLERMCMFAFLYTGSSIAYAENIETVAANLIEARPTIMVSVPRLFDKIYAKVIDQILAGSALKKKIFFWAVKVGKKHGRKRLAHEPIPAFLGFQYALARKLVYSKILAKTGGRVRFFVSGGAPLSKDIAEFFYLLGLTVIEGYGLTETSPVIACNTIEGVKFGTVGRPLAGVEVKIAPDGEILMRGPNLMKGYYKKEAETREAIVDGWFHTGDIGFLDDEGFLVITDRKKDLIVTAGGKNVAPQPIENLLKTNPYIANAVVVGGSRKFISALIVPDFDKLEAYARAADIAFGSREELITNPEIRNFMLAEVTRSTPNLAQYERVKRIALLDHDFDIEKGEITPTLKVRRSIVEQKYKPVIDAIYAE